MALAKDRISSVQSCAINGISSRVDNSLPPTLQHENGSPSIANTKEVMFQSECHINRLGGLESFLHDNGSLLSFANQKDDEYSCWDHGDSSYHSNQKSGLLENVNCVYSEGFDIRQPQHSNVQKRPHQGESDEQVAKKQCNNASKKTKPKAAPSKDPQSIAAKNRRERISERLKILQELVPNGSKVDLVTMLEKAISYVKFLQLQVKVLATDEFWPVQGGKAPDVSQVKEAIDAILSSHKDRNSSSSSV